MRSTSVFKSFKLQAAALILAGGTLFNANANDITGAGATFVFPVMTKWSADYAKTKNVRVNYQSIGSGGGIAQIKAGTVDFGSSDAPQKPEDLAKAGLAQFPSVIGGVVPVVNIPGVASGALKFDGPLLAQKITVVRRSDGSGTTFNFVNYLSKVSADWKSSVGEGNSVKWPVGVGGKGNEGVAAFVKQIRGGIGYVEFSYALQNKLTYVRMKNAAGNFVLPNEDTFQAAAASANWGASKDFYLVMTNAPGDQAWPIAATNFILMYKKPKNAAGAKAAKEFFRWVYANGDAQAKSLDYVPLPDALVKQIEAYWAKTMPY
jgi:phosphate transport system substrate-binding protein